MISKLFAFKPTMFIGRNAIHMGSTPTAWSPAALWPTGTEAGMYIDPSYTSASYQNSTGTTPLSAIGTVADSSNPVGLILDRRLGATALAHPGNHLLQATSTARPLASARRNLLIKTEDFTNAVWVKSYSVGVTGSKLYALAASSAHGLSTTLSNAPTGLKTLTVIASAAEYGFMHLVHGTIGPTDGVAYCATFNLSLGTVVKVGSWNTSASIVDLGGGVYECSCVGNQTTSNNALINFSPTSATNNYLGDGASGINIFKAQLERGAAKTSYQRVNTASDYTATGFPVYDQFDGVDDGLSTATFAAGTLTSSMDCLIAVRRDSAASTILGLAGIAVDSNKYFGACIPDSGSSASNCGAPTVWVDGVQLTGGTSVTRGSLNTAVTAGSWHIVEYRGLDLSAWAAIYFARAYTGYYFGGGFGGIRLFPSATDANRNLARTELAAKVGLVL